MRSEDQQSGKPQQVLQQTRANDGLEASRSRMQTKQTRVNRIFKDISPEPRQSTSPMSPVLQMSPLHQHRQALDSSNKSTSRLTDTTRQGCTLYYRQGYASRSPQLVSSIVQSASPQKVRIVKPLEVLEYENDVLRRQLQQRQQVLRMYKSGYYNANLPINDELVKSLNLKVAHKSVLIEQIHRSLVQFQEIVTKQGIQISPVCQQRFKILMQLIMSHQHGPVIINERILTTRRDAEKVYIRQQGVQQWQIKMEQSYRELTTIKQRLQWFERQNSVLQSTIVGLRTQKDAGSKDQVGQYKIEIQKLNNQVIMLQQDTSNYKTQISRMLQSIQQLRKRAETAGQLNKPTISGSTPPQLSEQLSTLRSQLNAALAQHKQTSEVLGQRISSLTSQLQLSTQRQQNLSKQLAQLQSELAKQKAKSVDPSKKYTDVQMNGKLDQIRNLTIKIGQIDKLLQAQRVKNKQLIANKAITDEQASKWKKHCQQAEDYIERLLKQIQGYKADINKFKSESNSSVKIQQQNNKLSIQIKSWSIKFQALQKQYDSIFSQLQPTKSKLRQYELLLSNSNKQLQQERSKWQSTTTKMSAEHSLSIQQIQIRIRNQYESIIAGLKREEERLKAEYQRLNKSKISAETATSDLRRDNQALNAELNKIKAQKNNRNYDKELQTIKQQYEKKLSDLAQARTKLEKDMLAIRTQMQGTISGLKRDIDGHLKQINKLKGQKSSKDWEKQIQNIRREYEIRLNDLQSKLVKAEQYIESSTRMSQSEISNLRSSLTSLQNENVHLKQTVKSPKDQYMYKVDPRYEKIHKKLLQLSTRSSNSVLTESEFWQRYQSQRKLDIQQIQSLIKQMMYIMSDVEQAVVVRRDELYRLDFSKLDEIIRQIDKIKAQKKELDANSRKQLETKFYGLLRTVATSIPQ